MRNRTDLAAWQNSIFHRVFRRRAHQRRPTSIGRRSVRQFADRIRNKASGRLPRVHTYSKLSATLFFVSSQPLNYGDAIATAAAAAAAYRKLLTTVDRHTSFLKLHITTLGSIAWKSHIFFIKLFKTSNIHIVQLCQELFRLDLPSVQLARRRKVCLDKFGV